MPTIVEQGKMQRTDVGIDLVNWVAGGQFGIDKMLHNSNQIVYCNYTNPRINYARYVTDSSSGNLPHLIDSELGFVGVSWPSSTKKVVVGYTNTPFPVSTSVIHFYTKGNWSTSNIKIEISYDNVTYTAVSATYAVTYINTSNVYKYVATFNNGANPPVTTSKEFNYIRISKIDTTVISSAEMITEVVLLPSILSPRMKFWFLGSADPGETDGSEGITRALPEGTLDVCYSEGNDVFYILKYNDAGGLTESVLSFNDDWTTISGTTSFNTSRWEESESRPNFIRTVDDLLLFNVSSGEGMLTSNFTLTGDFIVELEWADLGDIPASGTGRFELRAVDVNNNVIAAEGVSTHITSTDAVYYTLYASSIQNNADNTELKNLEPQYAVASGVQSWTLTSNGSGSWTVVGGVDGSLGTATAGTNFTNSKLKFLIDESSSGASVGQTITFDTHLYELERIDAAGTVNLRRSISTLATEHINPGTTITTDDVKVQIYGAATAPINVSSDYFVVTSGAGYYANFPSFSIHRMNSLGEITNDVVTVLDVINGLGFNDNNEVKTYNDFIGGVVGICTDNDYVFVKIEDKLMRFNFDDTLISSDGETGILDTTGEIPVRDVYNMSTGAFNIDISSGESLVASERAILYTYYDSDLSQLSIRTVTTSGLLSSQNERELLLDETELSAFTLTKSLPIFINQNDFNTIYLIGTDGSLYQYNADDRLVAFINVNAEDPTLAAGTGTGTNVIASVCNAWGVPLSGKTISFSVTDGDGSIAPATRLTDSDGVANQPVGGGSPAYPVFTVGSSVSPSTITATVSE